MSTAPLSSDSIFLYTTMASGGCQRFLTEWGDFVKNGENPRERAANYVDYSAPDWTCAACSA